MENYEDKATN